MTVSFVVSYEVRFVEGGKTCIEIEKGDSGQVDNRNGNACFGRDGKRQVEEETRNLSKRKKRKREEVDDS